VGSNGQTSTPLTTTRPDHPHVRGEHPRIVSISGSRTGPSPRAWGALPLRFGDAAHQRTIPTCVGSTRSGKSQLMTWADHPHVRGEHVVQTQHCHATAGPSPRAWGARGHELPARVPNRTIPTCVGSTGEDRSGADHKPDHPHVRGEHTLLACWRILAPGPSPRAWGAPAPHPPPTTGQSDHPHVRGEHQRGVRWSLQDPGPSPRAWGARALTPLRCHAVRTIPTCVGSTLMSIVNTATIADHPHVRGEHRSAPLGLGRTAGPSPRAWGAQPRGSMAHPAERTIPTCVGSTMSTASRIRSASDHPHVRGEHSIAHHVAARTSGPSPRAWGAHPLARPHQRARRTIPTCVGSTCAPDRSRQPPPDHPHVRGEHIHLLRGEIRPGGPSPRAWGARHQPRHRAVQHRTIPTCVGST